MHGHPKINLGIPTSRIIKHSRLLTLFPKCYTKKKARDDCCEETNGVIAGIPPVGQTLFPETCSALSEKRSGIL